MDFYDGIPQLFMDLQTIAKEHVVSNPSVEFYIISGGLEAIIRGSKIASYFQGIWGCRFAEENNVIRHVTNAISFTEKTKYVFEINKGVNLKPPHPYAVNEAVDKKNRRIPFRNMIYLGDGLTDVPCFSLIGNESSGGKAFGVFDPKKEGSPKKGWEKLVVPHRVATLNSPKYGQLDDLGSLLRMAVKQICIRIDVEAQTV